MMIGSNDLNENDNIMCMRKYMGKIILFQNNKTTNMFELLTYSRP